MKRLLLLLLASYSFSIPLIWRYRHIKEGRYQFLKKGELIWTIDDTYFFLGVAAVIIIIVLSIYLISKLPWESEEDMRKRTILEEKYKKDKLISHGHDMKELEEKYRRKNLDL